MKLLNLDEIQRTTRNVRVFGKDYEVESQSLGFLIETLQGMEVVEKENFTEADAVKKMATMVKRLIPSMPTEVIYRMTNDQIRAIFDFISAPDVEVTASASAEGESEKK